MKKNILLVLCLGAIALWAQVAGRVTGLVVDASGAAVPNATVSLQLTGTDQKVFSTTTSSGGEFSIAAVRPDAYDLVVEAQGFLKATIHQLKVDPGRETAIPTIKLEVGSVASSVDVVANTDNVQTSNAELATTITNSQIQNLPVINRSPLAFVQTQVGVNSGRGNTTINGQRPTY